MRPRLTWVFALAAVVVNQAAFAQFPEKPVTILTGYGPGSPGDQIARGLAKAVRAHFPQPLVVENRPGASGTLAIAEALRAKPDGYVLGLATAGNLTIQPHVTTLQYAGPDTYVPVAKLVNQPNVLMVRAESRWKTAKEFLGYAASHPGEITVGVAGRATVAHIDLEQLKRAANVDLRFAFYDGPQQVQAALAGKVDAAIAGAAPIMAHVQGGRALVLGVFDERRLRALPEVPTFKELGFDATLGTFQALVAPFGTPASVVAALAEAIRRAVSEPSFISLVEETGNTIEYEGPEAFAADLRGKFEKNGELVRSLGLSK
ncbi:MAG: Bug family tripartite tricarboxylate transporter substrate binding protein [Usitatibacter sp.]